MLYLILNSAFNFHPLLSHDYSYSSFQVFEPIFTEFDVWRLQILPLQTTIFKYFMTHTIQETIKSGRKLKKKCSWNALEFLSRGPTSQNDNLSMKDLRRTYRFIDWIEFAVSAIFQPCNGGHGLIKKVYLKIYNLTIKGKITYFVDMLEKITLYFFI